MIRAGLGSKTRNWLAQLSSEGCRPLLGHDHAIAEDTILGQPDKIPEVK